MPMDLKDKKNIEKNKRFVNSVEFALTGIRTVYRDERNMRSHTIVGILVVIAGFIFRLNRFEWLWILLSVFLVIIMEIINTAFENVVDMVTNKHFHPLGKKIKDMAAGAVLITSLFAMLIGAIIFLPKIIQLIFH
ncbi:diacylglycerol kinase family protein [Enterococcus saccharolyticus]|uniref:UDP kinase n=1 Tax=Candidatus Enterococcus willemsii TaxID=1857215 RepID=A0ABQ6Z2J2_9ENTE|nr:MULTISPECIES: diacylglycerol kinase family protein [Enterococcus]KAF1305545.1 UDP kinase [Enterococcus sp. CU12B]MCD5002697.1 diacylglycerol kinase family protein [Enterococcus saccharolyticus]